MSTHTTPTSPHAPAVRSTRSRRPAKRPSPAARRFGYLVAIAVNVVFLVLIHVSPGWQEASFLTDDAAGVLGWVTAALVVTLVANVVWLVADPLWSRALGDLVGALVGMIASIQWLTVFPFTFEDGSLWPTVIRVALWVAVVGGAIGVVANLVALVNALRTKPV